MGQHTQQRGIATTANAGAAFTCYVVSVIVGNDTSNTRLHMLHMFRMADGFALTNAVCTLDLLLSGLLSSTGRGRRTYRYF